MTTVAVDVTAYLVDPGGNLVQLSDPTGVGLHISILRTAWSAVEAWADVEPWTD